MTAFLLCVTALISYSFGSLSTPILSSHIFFHENILKYSHQSLQAQGQCQRQPSPDPGADRRRILASEYAEVHNPGHDRGQGQRGTGINDRFQRNASCRRKT